MGAHTTIRVTRAAATEYLLRQILRSEDDELERMLDAALDQRLYNVRIVGSDESNDDELLRD